MPLPIVPLTGRPTPDDKQARGFGLRRCSCTQSLSNAPVKAEIPDDRDLKTTWWQYPCGGGIIVVEVGTPPDVHGSGHEPLRVFIEPDDVGGETGETAANIKGCGHERFKQLVEEGKLTRIC